MLWTQWEVPAKLILTTAMLVPFLDCLQLRSGVLGADRAWPKTKYCELGLLTSSLCSYFGRVWFWTKSCSQLLFPSRVDWTPVLCWFHQSPSTYHLVWQTRNLHSGFSISIHGLFEISLELWVSLFSYHCNCLLTTFFEISVQVVKKVCFEHCVIPWFFYERYHPNDLHLS